MKRIVALLMVASILLSGCEYDDGGIWREIDQVKDRLQKLEEAVKQTNDDIDALQTIVGALQQNVYVTAVNTTADGYTIAFSDGNIATITNGVSANAPIISVKLYDDGNYYWTLDGEWLLVDGNKIRANGLDGAIGATGADAIAPKVRINETTKEWEISTDNGQTWTSTGIVAEGKNAAGGSNESNQPAGVSIFKSVDTSDANYVMFVLADGTELRLARYDETMPVFEIVECPELSQIEYGVNVEFVVNAANISDYVINVPQGWKAVYNEGILVVTAPEKDVCHFDKEGTISITIVSEAGKSAIVKLNVMAGEWVEKSEIRTLTFEDEDAKFEPYECEFNFPFNFSDPYVYAWVEKWSDYIPRDGKYGNGHGSYEWYDQNNTELAFVKPEIASWWGISGHAGISDYVGGDEDIEQYEDDNMLYVMDLVAYNVSGGANGSKNFCSQYGYLDPEEYETIYSPEGVLPGLQFYDEVPRVIEHMYVTNTCYTYKILVNGEKDFGGAYEYTDDCTFKIVAYGYDSMDDTEPTQAEFYLLNTNKRIVTDWTKWDLSSLGAVVRVEFNLIASDSGYGIYGNVLPAYFAYDDVAVRFNTIRVFE